MPASRYFCNGMLSSGIYWRRASLAGARTVRVAARQNNVKWRTDAESLIQPHKSQYQQLVRAIIASPRCFRSRGWKWLARGGATPSIWNFGWKWPRWSEIADFRYLFARSDSAVTPSEKSSIKTNRKFTTRFLMSPRWTSYVVPKPPNGGSKTQSVRNLNKLR